MYGHLEQRYLMDYGADSENFKNEVSSSLKCKSKCFGDTEIQANFFCVYIYIEPHLFFGSLFCSIIHPVR